MMWEDRNAYRVTAGKPEVKDHMDDLGVDGRTVLNQILKKYQARAWTGLIWFMTGEIGGLSKHKMG